MLTTGFIVGILAYLSLALTFTNLHPVLQLFALRHHFITEFLCGLILWGSVSFLTHSLIALIALFVAELLIWLTLKYGEDYIIEYIKKKFAEKQKKLAK